MTGRTTPSRPTEAELEILQVLWEHGACTVRDVHEVLHRRDGTGYTTALKQLQIMFEKRMVDGEETHRAHVYRAAVSKDRIPNKSLSEMLQRVLDSRPYSTGLLALGDHKVST